MACLTYNGVFYFLAAIAVAIPIAGKVQSAFGTLATLPICPAMVPPIYLLSIQSTAPSEFSGSGVNGDYRVLWSEGQYTEYGESRILFATIVSVGIFMIGDLCRQWMNRQSKRL